MQKTVGIYRPLYGLSICIVPVRSLNLDVTLGCYKENSLQCFMLLM